MTKMKYFLFLLVIILLQTPTFSQVIDKKSDEAIKKLVQDLKQNIRGPYKDIRWFCPDGSVLPAKEPCPDDEGVQHARYKNSVVNLGETNHIFLGQILTYTSPDDFWDPEYYNARLKQYQLEKYLRAIDDGWIMHKGQFYRGAIQVEDEEAWGIDFFRFLFNNPRITKRHFFLLREAAKDIPHRAENHRTQNIRALSKIISEKYSPFFKLRTKIHVQPDATDLNDVKKFFEEHQNKMDSETSMQFKKMIAYMEIEYELVKIISLERYMKFLPKKSKLRNSLKSLIALHENDEYSPEKLERIARLLRNIRQNIKSFKGSKTKLALLDLSIDLEKIFIQEAVEWQPENLSQLLNHVYYLGMAAMGCGYIEQWEWYKISTHLQPLEETQINLVDLIQFHEYTRRLVELGIGMNNATYKEVIETYGGFEPLAYGFLDDRIRSSMLLPLGKSTNMLGEFVAKHANYSNQVMGISHQSSIRGLNPGYAFGQLVVVDGSPENVQVEDDKIYIFNRTTSDLKPVAGIATVSEGNLVSHVQLLARNLGIPNAVLSSQNLKELKKYAGREIFYAVSNKGTVIMKPENEMTEEEKNLFARKSRRSQKVEISTKKINLNEKGILDLRDIRSKDSGKICGPKAANLGQLKSQFPEMVVEGIVIPFGIFREHLDQRMPNSKKTYWNFLKNIFSEAEDLNDESEAEKYILNQLAFFRKNIQTIPLSQKFITELKAQFHHVLGKEMGHLPVFVRSDTNMEDLKEFTGSGLNLTLFNVVNEEKIIQGIRDVWASPFKERSYRWRQKFLSNPENVFPSILIIPSVNVNYSGVLITTGITSHDRNDLTVAFSRGAGGAVDGQAAESYLLKSNGENILLSPAREPRYRIIPPSGGSYKVTTTFEKPILKTKNLQSLRLLAEEVKKIMPQTPGINSDGPFDIELGFKDDQIWLFQIRPFVENKNAKGSAYLKSITPRLPIYSPINISTPL